MTRSGTCCRYGLSLLAMVVGAACLAACTQRGAYEGSLMWRLESCRTLESEARRQCERDARRSFDEYAEQREAVSADDGD